MLTVVGSFPHDFLRTPAGSRHANAAAAAAAPERKKPQSVKSADAIVFSFHGVWWTQVQSLWFTLPETLQVYLKHSYRKHTAGVNCNQLKALQVGFILSPIIDIFKSIDTVAGFQAMKSISSRHISVSELQVDPW